MQLDRAILGDNQFFGINHRSEDKALSSKIKFQDTRAILDVLGVAYDGGIHAFSFSTHDRVNEICDFFRAHPDRFSDLRLYPTLPYAHKYADLVAEKGVVGALTDVVAKNNPASKTARMLLTGMDAVLRRDALGAMEVLVDAELKMFNQLSVKVVFLQNIVTDLMFGLGWTEPFKKFHAHIRDHYGAEAGFITLNLPAVARFLVEQCDIPNPIVCSAINKLGFQMNPSRQAYEEVLGTLNFRPMAMSVLAAGGLSPRDALAYIAGLPRVESVLFGASTGSRAIETKQLVDEALSNPPMALAASF